MKTDDRFKSLHGLSDWQLVNEDQDIRGYPVRSITGEEYGKIDDMLVDKDNEHVLAVRMEDGRLVGVEHLDIRDDHVIYTDDHAASPVEYRKVRRHS
ncbi:PRC-barrel domain-containing protein [Altererythrobacter sp. MTPC7]|uniref:PRC-barrel domain-containing protein n=1 Tax=Altererythrobacter sp. MTPC7 TaxID=3056567 RepID=UPI0036F3F2CA